MTELLLVAGWLGGGLTVVGLGLASLALIVWRFQRDSCARRSVDEICNGLGFQAVDGSDRLYGERRGLGVWVELRGPRAVVTVDARASLSLDLTIEPRTEADSEVTVTGDRAFDAAIRIDGESLATLDSGTRHQIRTGCEGLVVRRGFVVGEADLCGVVATTERLVTIAEKLQSPIFPERALLRIFRQDPVREVRYRCLRELIAGYPESNEARAAAESALHCVDRAQRLSAAEFLGDYDALSEILDDQATAGIVRAHALRALVRTFPESSHRAALGCLEDANIQVRRAAVEVLSRRPDPVVMRALCDRLRMSSGPDAAHLANALGQVGNPAAEPALIYLLETGDIDERLAAVRALELIGTEQSVGPLEQEVRRVISDHGLRDRAKRALSAIQSGARPLGPQETGELRLPSRANEQARPPATPATPPRTASPEYVFDDSDDHSEEQTLV